jgi:hypothetical protein
MRNDWVLTRPTIPEPPPARDRAGRYPGGSKPAHVASMVSMVAVKMGA